MRIRRSPLRKRARRSTGTSHEQTTTRGAPHWFSVQSRFADCPLLVKRLWELTAHRTAREHRAMHVHIILIGMSEQVGQVRAGARTCDAAELRRLTCEVQNGITCLE